VIEELHHAHRVVAHVRRLAQAVILADVFQHDDRLLQPPQRVVVLDALREVDGAVLVVVQNHERRLYVLREEHR
jgi:hypothetical protein